MYDSAPMPSLLLCPWLTKQVAFIEKDQKVQTREQQTQEDVTWGLGRISHVEPNSTEYVYNTSAGEGAQVYVVDTGIYTNHSVSHSPPTSPSD